MHERTPIIETVFEKFHENSVNYATMRGWDGQSQTGSDIDVLIDERHYSLVEQIFTKLGFETRSRGKLHFDYFANELYFDKYIKENLLRFHITDRLVFGKPARRIRFPFENEVLEQRCFSNGMYVMDESISTVLHAIRTLVDKPNKIRLCNEVQINKVASGLHLCSQRVEVIKRVLEVYNRSVNGDTNRYTARLKTIWLLKNIHNSEYYYRIPQYYITKPTIILYQTFIKPYIK